MVTVVPPSGSPTTTRLDLRRWYLVYVALAAVALLAIGISLNLNHELSGIYTNAVAVNREWATRVDRYSTLGYLAARVNAPGNDVFDSRDPVAEERRLDEALSAFRAATDDSRRDLTRIDASHRGRLLLHLERAAASVDVMAVEARVIFERVRAGDHRGAATRMAAMDRTLATASDHLASLRGEVAGIQADELSNQAADGARLKRVEWLIALLAGMMVVGLALYGHAMTRTMRRVAREREGYLAEVETASARMHAVMHNTADPIVTFDEHGRILFANPATCAVFGLPVTDLTGRNVSTYVPTVGRLSFATWLRELDVDAPSVRVSAEGQAADGSALHLTLAVSITNDHGEPCFTAIVHNLTREREAVELMAKAKTAADEANKAKSAFLANMSHELRTPLNAIIGYSEMLKEDAAERADASAVEDLERIRSSGKHLLSLIDEILDISKVEAGRMTLTVEAVSLPPLVEDLLVTVRPLAQRHQNELVVDIPEDLGTVHADGLRLKQVLLNLLANAAKFTEKGRVGLRAARVSDAGRELVRFDVSDTGIGMSSAEIERLFQPFVQADASVTRKYGGTGLGLTISHRLVELMGGRLSVTSQPGLGSTFSFSLPASIGTSTVVGPKPSSRGAERIAHDGAMPDGAVLVIDDDPAVQRLLAAMFADKGLSTLGAATAAEGLRLARESKPLAITLDLLMPEMEGWNALAALSTEPALSTIPVVVLSVLNDRGVCYTLGSTHWLAKPLELEALSSTLARVLGDRGAGRALIVDDDENSRELMKKRLHSLGWECVQAENGRAGLDILEEARPDLVLLDLMMPELDGFAFLDHLRRMPEWSSLPVVVVTAKDLTPLDLSRLRGDAVQLVADRTQPRRLVLEQVGALVASHVGTLRPAA